MDILVNIFNYSRSVSVVNKTFYDELGIKSNIDFYGKRYPTTGHKKKYDVIIFHSQLTRGRNAVKDFGAQGFKVLVALDWIVYFESTVVFCKYFKIDMILSTSDHRLEEYRQALKIPVVFMPWSVDNNIFQDYGLEKKYDIAAIGTTTNSSYDLRAEAVRMIEQYFPNSVIGTKGRTIGKIRKKYREDISRHPIGAIPYNTAKAFNQSRIGICIPAFVKMRFLIKKFFEIPACRTMLMCVGANSLNHIFSDGEECVMFKEDLSDFREKCEYYLKNESERARITDNAYNKIMSKHTHKIRSEEFIKIFKEHI